MQIYYCADVWAVCFCSMLYLSSLKVNAFTLSFISIFLNRLCVFEVT